MAAIMPELASKLAGKKKTRTLKHLTDHLVRQIQKLLSKQVRAF